MLVLLGLAIVAALLLHRRDGQRPEVVLLVTIDTMRRDALTEEIAPALTDLARRGTRFEGARTVVPLTLPAHVSLFTGRPPTIHGIRDNASVPLAAAKDRPYRLLAEEFAAAGWFTAAFAASSVLDPRFGIDSGFHRFERAPKPRPGAARFDSIPAPQQVKRVREWAAGRQKDKPLFLWVHLFDPHAEYHAYAGDERGRPATDASDPPLQRYLGEVSRADAAVEALVKLFDPETTLVVVVSDHGEGLEEHGERTHGHLVYGSTMDVPLLFAGPGVPAGVVDRRTCSLIDVAPAIRRLCGLKGAGASDRLFGPETQERIVLGESLYGYRLYGWSQMVVASNRRFSLVTGGPVPKLFDLLADPGETRPLEDPAGSAAYAPLDRAQLRMRTGPELADGDNLVAGAPTIYGSTRIPLTAFLTPKENRARIDPERGLESLSSLYALRQAVAARARGVITRLLPEVEALERMDSRNPAPPFERGRALRFLKRYDGAARAFQEAWDRGYRTDAALRLWVAALVQGGDREGVGVALDAASGLLQPATLARIGSEAAAALKDRN